MKYQFQNTVQFAKSRDEKDPIKSYRDQFHIPLTKADQESIYLCGHSLGLQPKNVADYVSGALKDWAKLGVAGHFHGEHPWLNYHELVTPALAKIIGAKTDEVVAMNSLTTNLHLLMVSFYRPTKKRHKILVEKGIFPSDLYAIQSQINYHGFDPATAIIEVNQSPDEHCVSEAAVLEIIEKQGQEIALILLPGVQFRSGQVFDMEKITACGHRQGCMVGFDLAHGVGNIVLNCHQWQMDFAVWCHYKYLNAGPGAIGGCFVHERHLNDKTISRFAGWWGHNKETRFDLVKAFDPMHTVEAWQLSNQPILQLAALRASLEIFEDVGMEALRAKSVQLTAYLEFLLRDKFGDDLTVITPVDFDRRGAQLSVTLPFVNAELPGRLYEQGIFCDFREPNLLRIGPMPLYNSFLDVFMFVDRLSQSFESEARP